MTEFLLLVKEIGYPLVVGLLRAARTGDAEAAANAARVAAETVAMRRTLRGIRTGKP